MIFGLQNLDADCLKRSDIAKFLQISTKHAGRLMQEMPTFRVGRTHRRVLRVDFEKWLIARREVGTQDRPISVREAAVAAAGRYIGFKQAPGTVVLAAQKLAARRAQPKK